MIVPRRKRRSAKAPRPVRKTIEQMLDDQLKSYIGVGFPEAMLLVGVHVAAEKHWYRARVVRRRGDLGQIGASRPTLNAAVALAVERDVEDRRAEIRQLEQRLAELLERTPKVTPGVPPPEHKRKK